MGHRTSNDTVLWAGVIAFLAAGVAIGVAALRLGDDRLFAPALPWVVLAVGFLASDRFTARIEVRRTVHVVSFNEIPVVFGLLFATPTEFLVLRVAVAAVALVVVRRPPLVKLVFNVALWTTEAGLALIIVQSLTDDGATLAESMLWPLLVAIGVSHLVSAGAVALVMRATGSSLGGREHLRLVGVSALAALASTALACAAATAYHAREVLAWLPLIAFGGGLSVFFVSFIRMQARHRDLDTLHRFTSSLGRSDTTVDLARVVVTGTAELLHAGRVMLLVPIDGVMARVTFDSSGTEVCQPFGVTGQEVDTVLDLAGAAIADGGFGFGFGRGRRESLAARLPLEEAGGLIVVDARSPSARPFDAHDQRMLQTAAGHAAAALHNAQLLARLHREACRRAHHALHDDVTDLPNRRAQAEQIDVHLGAGDSVVVLTVQVTDLREVNATLGQASGDQLLTQVAKRLRALGGEPSWTRTGGEEFTVLVPGGPVQAGLVSDAIDEAFRRPVVCDDVAISVRLGIGFALAPDHGLDAEVVLQRASLAASWSGSDRSPMTAWSPERDPAQSQQLRIAADLRSAIPAGELQVLFQPQMDIRSGLIDGVEALVRWHHPRLGLLTPDRFIPAAENTGAIDALTRHVLDVATATGARWRERGWDLDVAVNLSARSLTNARFADDVARILAASGLPPASLTLELTESTAMTDSHLAMRTLEALDAIGLSLAIDDFGTGYSSLAHLRRLPMSEIKIDKSFVLDLTTNRSDEVIVRSLIELGRNLGLVVTIEGVETAEIQRRVTDLGGDRVQGYLLSRPMAESAFDQWARTRPMRMLADHDVDRIVRLFPDVSG